MAVYTTGDGKVSVGGWSLPVDGLPRGGGGESLGVELKRPSAWEGGTAGRETYIAWDPSFTPEDVLKAIKRQRDDDFDRQVRAFQEKLYSNDTADPVGHPVSGRGHVRTLGVLCRPLSDALTQARENMVSLGLEDPGWRISQADFGSLYYLIVRSSWFWVTPAAAGQVKGEVVDDDFWTPCLSIQVSGRGRRLMAHAALATHGNQLSGNLLALWPGCLARNLVHLCEAFL